MELARIIFYSPDAGNGTRDTARKTRKNASPRRLRMVHTMEIIYSINYFRSDPKSAAQTAAQTAAQSASQSAAVPGEMAVCSHCTFKRRRKISRKICTQTAARDGKKNPCNYVAGG